MLGGYVNIFSEFIIFTFSRGISSAEISIP
jgi:hypothetical protein